MKHGAAKQVGECWASAALQGPPLTAEGLSDGWEDVGKAEHGQEDAWKPLRGRGNRRSVTFWLITNPDSALAAALPAQFWLDFDVLGGGSRLLLSRGRAHPGVSRRRAPEKHPGAVYWGTPVCIALNTKDGAMFDRVEFSL